MVIYNDYKTSYPAGQLGRLVRERDMLQIFPTHNMIHSGNKQNVVSMHD